MTSRRWLWLGGGVFLLLLAVLLLRPRSAVVERPAERRWEPLDRRVTIEVLNSGGVTGAGRAGMLLLRRAGLDVVYVANADSALSGRDRNQILVRRGDTTGVGRALDALGDGEVVTANDPARLVDLTILLGKRFRVPKGN
ncbi:MAG: LytR C-terminal domain-containing protein [Gemmatimonadota bacterium]